MTIPYYDGETFRHRRFVAVPDYSIVRACRHTILCVGGAISIDRLYRMQKCEKDWEDLLAKMEQGHMEPQLPFE